MPFDFGEVVLVPFPFTNQAASKKRPAVVISNKAYNNVRLDIVVMAITSQLRTGIAFGDTRLVQWRSAGLLKPFAVKPALATIEQRLILRRLGRLLAEDQMALRKSIFEIIG